MSTQDHPISELFRLAAETWVDLDAAARMHEELKTAFLEKMKNDMGEKDLPDSHRERIVKSSTEWKDYIIKMVRLRKEANRARVQLEYLRMKSWERQSTEANRRAEQRMP